MVALLPRCEKVLGSMQVGFIGESKSPLGVLLPSPLTKALASELVLVPGRFTLAAHCF